MLDASIPLMAKGIDGLKMLEDGSQIAQLWQNQKTDGELNRLYKETNGDLNKMMEIGKTSPMARFVMPQLQAQQAAQQKAALDQQKIEADIGKTQSESWQNNEAAQGKKLANAQILLTSANQALYVATQSGDADAVKLALNNAKTAGLLDEATYNQYFATAEGLSTNPEGLKSFALNLQKAYAQNPEKYNFTTADNQLDNATTQRGQDISSQTTMRGQDISAETSRYGTDVSANTADKNRVQQGQQFSQNLALNQQKQYFEQNKPISFQTGNDGYQYAVYANGKGVKVLGDDGQPIKVQTKNANTNVPKIAELQGDNDTLNNTIASLNRAKNLSQKGIYDGALSSTRADIAGTFGGTEESRRTQEYNNIVMSNALSSLKATFGSSPTEGERAILLKIQASSDYPPEVRAKILDEAIAVAQKKIKSNKGQMGTLGGVSQQAAQPQVGNKPPIASFFE